MTMTARRLTACGTASRRPGTRGGKDDPNLALLRFDPDHAEIRLGGSSPVAGLKVPVGGNLADGCKDKVGGVAL
jgi:hypothetical protein